MKTLKRLSSVLLAVLMVMAMAIPAFAQDVGTAAENTATITIQNAAKGETYKVYKLFDATVTGTTGGSIAYTGEIPNGLSSYFTEDTVGNISVVADVDNTALFAALKTWTESTTATASATSDGSTLNFNGLAYGYYVVTTTQGASAITVTSTNPNATIVDKNSTEPGPGDEEGNVKTVGDTDVSIGDTVTYTVKFTTTNFEGAGEDAKRILSYTITDTLPDFLENVTVTSIKIGNNDYKVDDATPQFVNKSITIPWVDENKTSLYDNGAVIEITYTATVNDTIEVGGADTANKNEVTVSWKVDDGTEGGSDSKNTLKDDVVIKTYAAAIQKVDESNKNLAGAKFQIKGLTVTGSKGNYTVVSYDKSEDATDGTEMEADDNGLIVINGIASDETLVATETVAPDGYNKLTTTVDVTPVETSQKVTTTTTTTTTYYDADGNIVSSEEDSATSTTTTTVSTLQAVIDGAQKIQNQKGTTLPSTGGMGTTLFYLVGAVLVVGAGLVLVTKRRVSR